MIYHRQIFQGVLLALLCSVNVNANNVVYDYDELGRISSVTYPNLSKIDYHYDELGNRTQVWATAQGLDSDDDGIPDAKDSFADDANESFDTDGDGVGDNSDEFALDSSESRDFDGDLIGDNADLDDDNDGTLDVDDGCPLNANGIEDMDQDGLCGSEDADSDGDGVPNVLDAFDFDPTESVDSDQDGIGDNADLDDDNDGVNDVIDQCPLDPTGHIDSNSDGRCDNYVVTANGMSFWSDNYVPQEMLATSTKAMEVGNKFISEHSGYVMAVRFYKLPQTQGVVTGNLWDYAKRKIIATATFTQPAQADQQGWQQALFDNPVYIEANKTYIVSYFAPAGQVAMTPGYLATQEIVKGPLLMPNTLQSKGNSVYRVSSKSVYPSKRTKGDNYWVDVVFDVDGDGLNPIVDLDDDNDGVLDTADACPLDPNSATDLDDDGICDPYDADKDGDGVDDESDQFPLDGTETQDSDGDGVGDAADFDDDNDNVDDMSDDCPTDASGHADQDQDGACDNVNITEFGLSLWNDLVKPDMSHLNTSLTDHRGIEAGIYFSASVEGYVRGLRFYKQVTNDDIHSVTLWDMKTRKPVATKTLAPLTSSGWQDVLFDQAVLIEANTQYIASYYSSKGSVTMTERQFTENGIISGPLSAQSDSVNRGNGAYRISTKSRFPSSRGKGKHYWVDVIYEVDNDGVAPHADTDDDDDGVPDLLDACPFDPAANADLDGDHICDSEDPDIDGDGTANDNDQFPYDASEQKDSDGDGVGNNADMDDDNDTANDSHDHCPLDPSGYFDQDGDGHCDNAVATAHGFSLWSDLAQPEVVEFTPAKGIETGMQFISSQAGFVMGVRFFKATENTGIHSGSLWDAKTKELIATIEFTNETNGGWQTALFAQSVAIEANKTYVISYFSPLGNVLYHPGQLLDQGLVSGPLAMPSSVSIKGNGVYRYGKTSRYPSVKSKGNNYWVDVVFEVDGDSIAPGLDNDDDNDTVPDLLDACPLNPFGSVDSDGDGICDSQDLDSDGDGVLNEHDLFPNDPLESLDSDLDGIGNVADLDDDNDNHLDINDACPLSVDGYVDVDEDGYCDNANITEQGYSVWNPLSTPDNFEVSAQKGIEVGMKFDVIENGYITGLRYYKVPEMAGTIVANLWDAKTKRSLVSQSFQAIAEQQGWQQVMFDVPVAIEANKTYLVSYFSAQGQVVYQEGYFTERGVRSGAIVVPSSTTAKGNGVYKNSKKSIFPSVKGKGKNYWVDVVFDIDLDGIAPAVDDDNDNDGIADNVDACPFDPLGSIDTDNDGICDSEDADLDGDGVANEKDAYPYDATEYIDTDGDGLGDTADDDDDSDGVKDANDACRLDPAGYLDSDGDGFCDNPNSSNSGNTLWHALSKPKSDTNTGAAGIEVGMKFTSLGGTAIGVRFYKTPENNGRHIGSLWDVKTKQKLSEVVFANESGTGWQEALFDQAISLEFGKEYMVSYYAANGNVVFDDGYFSNSSVVSGRITAMGGKNKNGFYRFGDVSRYPSSNGKGKNYWVDIVLGQQW